MIRRSDTRNVSILAPIGDDNAAMICTPTEEVDATCKYVLEKFATLSKVGSRNISFRGEELVRERDDGVVGLSIARETVLGTCLKDFTKLNLSLTRFALSGRFFYGLTSGFEHLRSLKLHNCKMEPQDCSNLADALRVNRTIKLLDLSHNRIVGIYAFRNEVLGKFDSDGLSCLLAALLASGIVESLNLSGNYLGGIRCAETILVAAKRESCIPVQCKIIAEKISSSGTSSVSIIEEFLYWNESVRILNLNTNEFSNDRNIAKSLLSHMHRYADQSANKKSKASKYIDTRRKRVRREKVERRQSPCQSLCGVVPVSSKSDYHNLQYSHFHPPSSDLVDLSNSDLDALTGMLLGAEPCFKMSSITALDLSRNTHFGNEGLFNFITSYRESNCTFHLKSLCLRNTGLDGMWRDSAGFSGIVSLSHFLSLPVNSITALDVSENHLFGDEGVALFFKNMSKSSILKYLNMSECAITSRASSNHIATYIHGNKTLELIDLSSNKINDEDFKNITFAIKNSKLKSLFLGLTKIQGDSLSAFSERLLSSRTCPLTHLCLKRNVLCGKRSGEDFNPESVVMVANALLESNRNLKYLNLSHCDIGARSSRKLMESVKYNDSLLVLDMGSCNISSIGGAAVAQALPFMKNLRSLNIRDNAIGPVGSNAIFEALPYNTSLTSLDISSNQLTGVADDLAFDYDADVVETMAEGIAKNVTLKFLDISDNSLFGLNFNNRLSQRMYDAAIVHLSKGIERNGENGGALETLNLTRNLMNLASSPDVTSRSSLIFPSVVFTIDFPDWSGYSQGYDGNDLEKLRAMEELEDLQTEQIAKVLQLVVIIKAHPHLQSVCGLPPHTTSLKNDSTDIIFSPGRCPTYLTPIPSTTLCLADQGIDDLMVLLISFDMIMNHTIKVLDLQGNYILAGGVLVLTAKCNVTVQKILVDGQLDPLPPGREYDQQRDRHAFIAPHVELVIKEAKNKVFEFRITMAVFARGADLGIVALRNVLECLMGPGPQVCRFLRYRNPCTALCQSVREVVK